jgi:transcriptional regulator with XRE-family HTH domain
MKTVYEDRYRAMIQQLRTRRLALGLDQRTVASKLGHTNRWLSKVERLDIRLDICQFADLCRALEVNAGRLVRRLATGASDKGAPTVYLSPGRKVRAKSAEVVRRVVRRGSYRVVFMAIPSRFKS